MEIKRKFLIEQDDDFMKALLTGKESYDIELVFIKTGYIEETIQRKTDLNTKDVRYLHTIKIKKNRLSDLVREKIVNDISEVDFNKYKVLQIGDVVHKVRYFIPNGKNNIEVSIYQDGLAGLSVAEVKFKNEKEAKAFEIPAYFGEEITDNKEYKNSSLAEAGLPKVDPVSVS